MRSRVRHWMRERLVFMKDAKGIHPRKGITMAIDEDHDNHYRVDYAYSTYDEDADIWVDSDYNSKPFATEDEARAYASRVINRASINPSKVKLYKLTIVYVDIQYWDEYGDFKIIQELMF